MAVTPTLENLLETARVVSVPMRTAFRGITQREALLFEGENGWAEWSPFVEYEDDEARTWLAAALDQGFGPKREIGTVNINATLPAVDGEAIAAVLSRFGSFDTVKIKVAEAGQSIEQDLARVAAVRTLYPEAQIRLDANGGYSVTEALRVAELAGELDYLEQPCRTIGELAELRVKLAGVTRIAADESVRKVEDPMAVVYAGAADVLVLKAQPLGGVTRALAIASECGLPVTVSSALETQVGLNAGLAFATALGGDTAHGLGTLSLFEDVDVFSKEALASEERREWWLARLRRCFI
ncbi:MAG: o-succinylbenzoate synthase [Actinomycetota bacterium]